jgi:hypothetical protein
MVPSADLAGQPVIKLEDGWEIVFIVPSRILGGGVIEYKVLYKRSDKDDKRKDFNS